MKKTLLSLLLVAAPLSLLAQLKVLSNGRVTVASTETNPAARITIGESEAPDIYDVGISSVIVPDTSYWSIGMVGTAYRSFACQSRTCGVLGIAGGGINGYNYGVQGVINGHRNGAGVFGSVGGMASAISGLYAGYFYGSAKVTGTMTVNSLVQTSDLRLKKDIISYNGSDEKVLNRVLDMNVIKYTYKDTVPTLNASDADTEGNIIMIDENNSGKRHIGLIAQELQDLFPELVEEGQDGYLGINYVELVPVLIRAIQELKAELDVTRSEASAPMMRAQATTDVGNVSSHGNVLYQNKPNPFNEQTTIRFSLADDARDASICIFDMQGKMLKSLPVSSGMESVSVNGYELGKGMFLYSLIVNGQEIDTKRMVISK